MNAPICDFLEKYNKSGAVRAHMPGHKGKTFLGCEGLDITEISGADSLYEANGIIEGSEQNASSLFGSDTFYSAEGSSLCIRAMLYLTKLFAKREGKAIKILAARNAHRSFLSAAALLDIEVEWIYPEDSVSFLSCLINSEMLDKKLSSMPQKPAAVFLTSPDYLGNMQNIAALSAVCKKHGCLTLIDNAHGAYLKFLPLSCHPIDLGADICCDSAHKTLPVLTGGAYLHISHTAPAFFKENAKKALSLFGSTSPSYLILASLDKANAYMAGEYREKLAGAVQRVFALKETLISGGYKIIGSEPLKITIDALAYGYYGTEIAAALERENIIIEFACTDSLTLMLNEQTSGEDIEKIAAALLKIEKREPIAPLSAKPAPERVLSLREAMESQTEIIPLSQSVGRIAAAFSVACPPAVSVVVGGERIDVASMETMMYYKINNIEVIKTI